MIVRKSIATQLKEHWAANGIPWQFGRDPRDPGRILYDVQGQTLTPGEAADKYLPGGFSGVFGKPVDVDHPDTAIQVYGPKVEGLPTQ